MELRSPACSTYARYYIIFVRVRKAKWRRFWQMRFLAAKHKAIMTAVKLSSWTQNLCSVLVQYNEHFAMLPRRTPLVWLYLLLYAILLTVCTAHDFPRGVKDTVYGTELPGRQGIVSYYNKELYGRGEMRNVPWSEILNINDQSVEKKRVDWRIILICIFKEWVLKVLTGTNDSG